MILSNNADANVTEKKAESLLTLEKMKIPSANLKKHSDYVTHLKNDDDQVYLRNVCYPVNMRLFNSSPEYRHIILLQCQYIRFLCLTTMDGYKKPHGMSAANAGLSFNIIGIVRQRSYTGEHVEIMINPKILSYGKDKTIIVSNCGSLTLEKPINIERSVDVEVVYYTETGESKIETRGRTEGSLTIQHEVEHNLGILIIDKEAEEKPVEQNKIYGFH